MAAKRKINPCFSGSRERHGESQPIVLGPFIRELISFGNTHDPTSQVFLNLGLEDRSKYLREGGRAKHAPSKVDPSAQLRLRTIREAEKFRTADSTRPKEWLEIEKVRPIGFIGKDILALEKKIPDPSEIIKQNQGFEISRLLNQQREQEQHPGIDR